MSMFGLPDLMHQVGVEDMGDLEFIQEKVIAGNYFQVSGDINTLASTISFTPASGKTAFLIEAKITMTTNPSASSTTGDGTSTSIDQVVAELKISGTTKSKAKIGIASQASGFSLDGGNGSGFGVNSESNFNVKGLSLVGTGSASITIENVLDSGSAFAEMSGYLV